MTEQLPRQSRQARQAGQFAGESTYCHDLFAKKYLVVQVKNQFEIFNYLKNNIHLRYKLLF